MAKKDNFDFDTDSKAKFSFDFGFLKNLTKKQKELILMIAIAVVLVVAIVIVGVVILTGENNGGNGTGGNNSGGSGSGESTDGENDTDQGDDDHDVDLDAEPTQIYVANLPTKTTYYVNDTVPNYSGLVIGVMEPNSSGFKLSYDEYPNEFTITGFDTSSPAESQEITVEYKGYTATFNIEIKAREEGATLVAIRVDPLPNKTTYKLGEALSYTGGRVVCEYSDGTTKTLRFKDEGVQISGFATITSPGEYDIKVEYYDDKGGYAWTTFKITMEQ